MHPNSSKTGCHFSSFSAWMKKFNCKNFLRFVKIPNNEKFPHKKLKAETTTTELATIKRRWKFVENRIKTAAQIA